MKPEIADWPADSNQNCAQMITEKDYRDAMGRFATGVAIVTATNANGEPAGATINTITSVSMRPPLLLWCLATSAPSFSVFRDAGEFAVNILPSHAGTLCRQFSHSGGDKFRGISYTMQPDGLPLLDDALAHIICSKWRRYPGGDHEIFVGQILRLEVRDDEPLIFYRGQLNALGPILET
jgi:flavin reductase (DIM6/NTAB) family NADH-FMN oxidoreductase RutF